MDILTLVSIDVVIATILIWLALKWKRKEKNIENKIDDFCEKHYKKIWIIFGILIFITVIYKFGTLPNYIGVDEAGMAYDSYCLATYGTDRYMNSYPLYLTNFGSGQSALCAYIAVFFIKILGPSIIAYRMPSLLIYLLGFLASYFLVAKSKDKKTALLFSFLILTCPWNIMTARETLDCNLYAGMFMISLFFMNRAEKGYQYIIAGILIGLTLYTYCLAWITIPIFLAVWLIYMLYLKKIKIKNIILLGIPIAILAMPLIYFLLLNFGIVHTEQIGIFTLPILSDFRSQQIGISSIWKTGLESINTIFLEKNTIYIAYIPLFITGYIISIKDTIKSIKTKEFKLNALITIAFTTLLFGLLLTRIPTANKANVLYIPILYFVTIALIEIFKKSELMLIILLILITSLFINFEYNYYTKYSYVPGNGWYDDSELMKITNIIENAEGTEELNTHIMVVRAAPFIYTTLEKKVSPQEFMNETEEKIYHNVAKEVTRVQNYHFYSVMYGKDEIKEIEFSEKDAIFVISKSLDDIVKFIENKGYKKQEYGSVYILTNDAINLEI